VGESGNFDDPARFHDGRRSSPPWVGQKSAPAKWQCHRCLYIHNRIRS
jgi:hypothetical protein